MDYKGFSSRVFDATGAFRTRGVETIKQDLLNHIFTSKGSRVHEEWFGTRIPDLAFEPIDEDTLFVIREDLTSVVNHDPRVEMVRLLILPLKDNNAIVAVLDLKVVETGERFALKLPIGDKY